MHIVNVVLPNADDMGQPTAGEVKALVNLVMRSASEPGRNGRKVSLDMLGQALGVRRGTLYSWMAKNEKPIPGKVDHGRGIPFSAFYCLQVLATNPAAARADVFSPMWVRIGRPILDRRDQAPDTPQ